MILAIWEAAVEGTCKVYAWRVHASNILVFGILARVNVVYTGLRERSGYLVLGPMFSFGVWVVGGPLKPLAKPTCY